MAHAPPIAVRMSSIPRDVLGIIFSLVAVRPRLRVLALVCRAWRSMAYASVTSLEVTKLDMQEPKSHGVTPRSHLLSRLSSFPNLTSLHLLTVTDAHLHCNQPMALPKCDDGFACVHFEAVTGLRSLTVRNINWCHKLWAMIRNNATSLTHISYVERPLWSQGPPTIPVFPRLQSLDLTCDTSQALEYPFTLGNLPLYTSQLTSLRLARGSTDIMELLTFGTLLRDLHICNPNAHIAPLLVSAPALKRLSIGRQCYIPLMSLLSLQHHLTSISVCTLESVPAGIITQFTNVQALYFPRSGLLQEPFRYLWKHLTPDFITRIRRLHLAPPASHCPVMLSYFTEWPSLTSLGLCLDSDKDFALSWSMPALRSLKVHCGFSSLREVFSVVTPLVVSTSVLRRLKITKGSGSYWPMAEIHLKGVQEFLAMLDERGVQVLEIDGFSQAGQMELWQLRFKYKWLQIEF